MSTKENKREKNKAIEYPVIYSYIYEREKEDIIRLAEKFKNTRKRNTSQANKNRIIIGYKIENGKAVPIYETISETRKMPTLKKGTTVSVRKTGITVHKASTSAKKTPTTRVKTTTKK